MKSAFSRLLLAVGLLWSVEKNPAHSAQYAVAGDIVGNVTAHIIQEDETLYELARQKGLGIVELLMANPGIDPWMPEPGTIITLPTAYILPSAPRSGIVINLSELRLYYYPGKQNVVTFPIGIGMEGTETPVGKTSIITKREHPVWVPPQSIRLEKAPLPAVVAAGPNNPLGDYALSLGWSNYVIHGTNKPYGIGKRSSHGCIRLYPEDIRQLFALTQVGTRVTVIDTPYKLGRKDETLFLEVNPTQREADVISEYGKLEPLDVPEIHREIEKLATHQKRIDWDAVRDAISKRDGIPVRITK